MFSSCTRGGGAPGEQGVVAARLGRGDAAGDPRLAPLAHRAHDAARRRDRHLEPRARPEGGRARREHRPHERDLAPRLRRVVVNVERRARQEHRVVAGQRSLVGSVVVRVGGGLLALDGGRAERELQPALRAAGVDDQVAFCRRVIGVRIADAEGCADRLLRSVHVHESELHARDAAQQLVSLTPRRAVPDRLVKPPVHLADLPREVGDVGLQVGPHDVAGGRAQAVLLGGAHADELAAAGQQVG